MSETLADKAAAKRARYGTTRPKVPAFARYEGTSVWRRNKRKVRAYNRHLAKPAA